MKPENEAHLQTMTQAVEEALSKCVVVTPETAPQSLVIDAMRYSLEAGGKRIRPVLVLEFCRVCGGRTEEAMSAACAVEMIHTFSLIHDDLPEMDNDDYRRGKLACHKVYGPDVALQAGDALAVGALEAILSDPVLTPERARALALELSHATGAAGMVGGQILDMSYEKRSESVTLQELEQMIQAKTGALIRASCKMGCIAAGADDQKVALAAEYGEKLGFAFQIVDDILDVTSTTEQLGKTAGSDLKEGKATFVSIMGLDAARERAAQLTAEALMILQEFTDCGFLSDLTQDLLLREK